MAHSIQDSFNGWVAVYVVYEKYLSGLDASSFIYSFSVSPLFGTDPKSSLAAGATEHFYARGPLFVFCLS